MHLTLNEHDDDDDDDDRRIICFNSFVYEKAHRDVFGQVTSRGIQLPGPRVIE